MHMLVMNPPLWVRSRCEAYFDDPLNKRNAFLALPERDQHELVDYIIVRATGSRSVNFSDTTLDVVQEVEQRFGGNLAEYVEQVRQSRYAEEAWYRRPKLTGKTLLGLAKLAALAPDSQDW